jgi:hypothetical protein
MEKKVLEKLTVVQLFKKWLLFYGIRRSKTVLLECRHWNLTWARRMQWQRLADPPYKECHAISDRFNEITSLYSSSETTEEENAFVMKRRSQVTESLRVQISELIRSSKFELKEKSQFKRRFTIHVRLFGGEFYYHIFRSALQLTKAWVLEDK